MKSCRFGYRTQECLISQRCASFTLGQIHHLIKRLTLILTILTTTTAWCQVIVVGTVITSDDKSAFPGVNVVEKGTETGTNTNADGKFSITVTDPNATLVFSFIGFQTQEFQLQGQTEIKLMLKLDCLPGALSIQATIYS
jgi:hypothetical protein